MAFLIKRNLFSIISSFWDCLKIVEKFCSISNRKAISCRQSHEYYIDDIYAHYSMDFKSQKILTLIVIYGD